jgi:hypothetical protein
MGFDVVVTGCSACEDTAMVQVCTCWLVPLHESFFLRLNLNLGFVLC